MMGDTRVAGKSSGFRRPDKQLLARKRFMDSNRRWTPQFRQDEALGPVLLDDSVCLLEDLGRNRDTDLPSRF